MHNNVKTPLKIACEGVYFEWNPFSADYGKKYG